jgi:hypothetical protein
MRFSAKNVILFFLAFGILGYLREMFFIYLNSILFSKYYGRSDTISVPSIMKAFERLDYLTLYYAKYPLTLIWAAAFLAMSYYCLRVLGAGRMTRTLVICYAIVIAFSAASIGISFLLHGKPEADEYTLSRWLLGIAQSPLICLIMVAASRLNIASKTVGNSEP